MSFAYHVGKDITVNGVNIYHDVEYCVTDYDQKEWFNFGKHLGDGLELLLVGS